MRIVLFSNSTVSHRLGEVYIFTIPGVKLFLSEKICQDPLEKFFGHLRQRGSSHENPNVYEAKKSTQALRGINTTARNVSRGTGVILGRILMGTLISHWM
jgi:hypothetical protein